MFKFETQFTVKDKDWQDWGNTPSMRYAVSVSTHESESCEDENVLISEAVHTSYFTNCLLYGNTCDKNFIIQKNHFKSEYFKITLSAEKTPKYEEEAFEKIDLIITQREYTYISTVMFFKAIFALCTCL
jgi:hypothetical protein